MAVGRAPSTWQLAQWPEMDCWRPASSLTSPTADFRRPAWWKVWQPAQSERGPAWKPSAMAAPPRRLRSRWQARQARERGSGSPTAAVATTRAALPRWHWAQEIPACGSSVAAPSGPPARQVAVRQQSRVATRAVGVRVVSFMGPVSHEMMNTLEICLIVFHSRVGPSRPASDPCFSQRVGAAPRSGVSTPGGSAEECGDTSTTSGVILDPANRRACRRL